MVMETLGKLRLTYHARISIARFILCTCRVLLLLQRVVVFEALVTAQCKSIIIFVNDSLTCTRLGISKSAKSSSRTTCPEHEYKPFTTRRHSPPAQRSSSHALPAWKPQTAHRHRVPEARTLPRQYACNRLPPLVAVTRQCRFARRLGLLFL